MGKLIFVTGPVRSGKSRFALEMARDWGDQVVYAATYRIDPEDEEMLERVSRHRQERPPTWRTLEAPGDMVEALSHLTPPPSGVLLDCLTVWLGGRLEASDEAIQGGWTRILAYFRSAPWPTVIVGNEVGWSLVPGEPELRRFRDLAGWLAQATARAADEAWLCVAGCPVRLKPPRQ
jgi:adenosyl cobinamide kinase/adenosyl cobinamide phosphate guanylyltransferase